MVVEHEFKVGNRVCTFWQRIGTVLSINGNSGIAELFTVTVKWDDGKVTTQCATNLWVEGQSPKFHYALEAAHLEHDDRLKREALRRQEEAEFEAELRNYPYQLKYKEGERIFYPHYGCGTVIKASSSIVEIRFAKGYERPLSTNPPMRHATAEDELYDPYAIEWQPAPEDDSATIASLVSDVDDWAQIVQGLVGKDNQDDIDHDMFTRECLHATLNTLNKKGVIIAPEVLNKLNQADQFFIDNSVPLAEPDVEAIKNKVPRMGPVTLLDPKEFWYRYRWPK